MEEDWNIVVDVTDNFESKISAIAIEDAAKNYNSLYNYIKATFLKKNEKAIIECKPVFCFSPLLSGSFLKQEL